MESPVNYNPNPPLPIPNILIKKNKLNNKDLIGTKYDYDKLGSNGRIEIRPKMVKFSGFEVNKNNIQKIYIVNSSAVSQRVHILPPASPYFQIKFEKKGNLAPGICEEISLIFKPSEYKYYFDAVKVHTESDKFQIPIHAFPVLNRENLREIFPKLIDFGVVEIGEQEKRVFPLISKIPLNFEYEFSFIKEHPDVYVHPSKGIIPGKGSVNIEISYTPSVNNTIDVDLELKISQFDFEPLPIKIKGTGKNKIEKKDKTKTLLEPIRKIPSKNIISEKNEEILESAKKDMKTLMKASRSAKQMARSLSFKDESTSKQPTSRQLLEKEFFDHSNSVLQLCKDRDIRFFTCLGDPWISEEKRAAILETRLAYKNELLNKMESDGVHRYGIEVNRNAPIKEEVLPDYTSTWDSYKNNTLEKRSKFIKIFVSKGTYVITQARMMKRLGKIREFLGEAKTREEVKRKVQIDWLKYEYNGLGKKDHVAFQFDFSHENVDPISFPYQYESTTDQKNDHIFPIDAKMTFDDLKPYAELPRSYFEEFNYKTNTPPYAPQLNPEYRSNRTGAEEEYFTSGPCGAFEKPDPLSLPSTCLKMFYFDFEKFITPHHSLRVFIRLPERSEIDPDFALLPEKIEFQDGLDPQNTDDLDVLKYEFISKTPGYFGIHAVNAWNVEMPNYFKGRIGKTYEYGMALEEERKDIDMMEKDEESDRFTDSDSDGDGPPDVQLDDWVEMVKKIEGDDKVLKDLKEKNENDIFDEYSVTRKEINQNFELERKKWGSVVPSKTADFNKFIEEKELKIVIY